MAGGWLPLTCFGKLPFWREYLEAGPMQTTSRVLKQWLHQGKEALGLESGDEQPHDRTFRSRLRVLVAPPESREMLVGVIRPSRDAGGRHFPFAAFTHLPRRIFGKHYALLPMALAPVWDDLEGAWDAVAETATMADFEQTVSSHEIREPVDVAEARADYQGRQREQASDLLSGAPGLMRSLRERMPDAVRALRKAASEGVGMQLPLARDLEAACFNVSLWIDLLNRQFLLRRFEPSVLLEAETDVAQRRVLLRFGALASSDYLHLMGVEAGDLLRPAAPLSAGEAQDEPPAGITYAEMLEARFS